MAIQPPALEEELLRLLFRVGRTLARMRRRDDGEHELSMLQLQALAFVGQRDSCSMSDLAGEFVVGLPSATALVDRLVRAELLSRAEDPNDRRVTRVRLTAAGRERLRGLRERQVRELRAVLARIPPDDREALVRVMRHLLSGLETEPP